MGNRSILLVSGLHANESAAPQIVAEVSAALVACGRNDVRHYQVPYEMTLLACVDAPEEVDATHCLPVPKGKVDVDLETLVGDEALRARFPGLLYFEFHNASNEWGHFGIDPDKLIEEYEVGTIMPEFTRAYEIGTWRNVLPGGRSGKYVIEMPAVFREVAERVREARLARVEQLRDEGYELTKNVVQTYLLTEVDLPATREKGLMGPTLVDKIASWIVSCLGC